MESIAAAIAWLRRLATLVAPYIILEAVMPGGTVMALLLYLHRRRLRLIREIS